VETFIHELINEKNPKMAMKLIEDYNFSINDFPQLSNQNVNNEFIWFI
jgi:hypothetical protein